MIKINLPMKVSQIINKIQKAGFEAYAVGGCVRDSILGREPDDWDITTSATPQEIKSLFVATIDTGIEHGTVTIMLGKEGFEVTTYRVDGEYLDYRRPSEVTFTSLLEEDLKRRDFTINAMAYNEKEGLIDLFGGREDIKNKTIRCVGNPIERFEEDALRIMRAVRFSAQLGYNIEEQTKEAMRLLAPNLDCISLERIQVEFVKLLKSDNPDYIRAMYEIGITRVVFSEFDAMIETPQNSPYHIYNVGEHTIKALKATPNDRIIRIATLLHDIGKPLTHTRDKEGKDHFHNHEAVGSELAVKILRRLRFDNDTIKKVSKIVLYHDRGNGEDITPEFTRWLMYKLSPTLFEAFLEVKTADYFAQSDYKKEEKERKIALLREYYNEAIEKDYPVSLKQLAVNGEELLEIGIERGKEIGEMLEILLQEVISFPEVNSKENLLEIAKKRMKS